MGYSHYWSQTRDLTKPEWTKLCNATRRIIKSAEAGEYLGNETKRSNARVDLMGERVLFAFGNTKAAVNFRDGFEEKGAWRTFSNPERPIPHRGLPIRLANGHGTPGTQPIITPDKIVLNGCEPEDYETLVLTRLRDDGSYGGIKTEYRAYDAVVISILFAASCIAPGVLELSSDGGDSVFQMLFPIALPGVQKALASL